MNYTMNFGAIRICLLFTPPFPHLPLAVALPGPPIMKSGPRYPLTTKKQEGGGGFVQAGTIFSVESAWCLWVGN